MCTRLSQRVNVKSHDALKKPAKFVQRRLRWLARMDVEAAALD